MKTDSSVAVQARNAALPLTGNKHLWKWVEKMAELTKPAAIHWVDGSQEEYNALCAQMVEGGTFIKLNEDLWPGCYYARSDASDVTRVRPCKPRDEILETFSDVVDVERGDLEKTASRERTILANDPAPKHQSLTEAASLRAIEGSCVNRPFSRHHADRLISLIPRPRRRRSSTRRIEPSVYPTRSAISSTLALLVFRRCTARSTRKLWK